MRREGSSKRVWILVAVVVAAIAVFVAGVIFMNAGKPETVSLSEAVTLIQSGKVSSAELSDANNSATLTEADGTQVVTTYPAEYSQTLTNELLKANVNTTAVGRSAWSYVGLALLNALPLIIIVGFAYLIYRRSSLAGGMGGDSLGEVPDVTFGDVAGCDEAVADLKEMAEFLRNPERFRDLGATVPRGALLTGPPGTGKTLLARAVAGEAKVPFFAVAGSDFVEMFVGRGASRVRKLFERARKDGKGIVFIDEIDAVGQRRGGGGLGSSGDSERESTLIALLNEMDGFKETGVIVIAATNRPDTLDEALTRPGRIDRQIPVNPPDRRGREAILKVHVRGKAIAPDVDLDLIALLTAGMVGAELAMVVNEACIEAARRNASQVEQVDLANAVQVIQLGRPRTSALITERDRKITAYHEAGHAITAELLENVEGPSVVSIIPRGQTGGATHIGTNDDQFLSLAEARDRLVMMMGGRVGETILLGDGNFTQGAAHDFQAATNLAYAMITQFGMDSKSLAVIDPDALKLGSELAVQTHEAANAYIEEALERARQILTSSPGKELVERLVALLYEEETVYREQMDQLHNEVLNAGISTTAGR